MKKIICCGIALCVAVNAFAAGGKPPLQFFKRPHFPKSITNGTATLNYTIINNTPITLPLTISSPTVSSGSISLSSNTCSATLASSAKCDLTYTFTAPANSNPTPVIVTGNFQIAYNGRYPLTDNTIRFIVPQEAPEFIEQPSFSPPITVPSSATHTLKYAIKNGIPGTITSVSFSSTVTSGSIATTTDGSTCGSSLTAGETCIQNFIFTAPVNAGSTDASVTGTMTFNYTYLGAQTLAGDNLAFSITPAAKPSITILEHSLMFPNRNFGASSSYSGSITISNNGTTTISSITTTPSSSTVQLTSSSGCTDLAAGSTCTETFSSTYPIDPDNYVTLTPHRILSGVTIDGNSVKVPLSGIGIIPLAPPTGSTAGLRLVNTCSDTTNDGGLLMLVNNTNETLEDIHVSASSSLSATITQSGTASQLYCKDKSLGPNEYCEVRVQSAVAATTGKELNISGTLVKNTVRSSAHLYEMQTAVVGQATPFSYAAGNSQGGGTVFVADNTCNLVQIFTFSSAITQPPHWSTANNYCSTTISSLSDWRLPDVGPAPTATLVSSQTTGEFDPMNAWIPGETDLDNIWLSPINNSAAWVSDIAPGIGSTMFEVFKDFDIPDYPNNVFCSRAFTTSSDGT